MDLTIAISRVCNVASLTKNQTRIFADFAPNVFGYFLLQLLLPLPYIYFLGQLHWIYMGFIAGSKLYAGLG